MKKLKQISRIIILMIITVFLFGCGISKNVFNDNIPKENIVQLTITNGLIVKSFNGIDVNLKTNTFGYTGFTIPAGRATIVFDIDYKDYSSTPSAHIQRSFTASDIPVVFNFEAGKEYFIWMQNGITISSKRSFNNEYIIHNVPINWQ